MNEKTFLFENEEGNIKPINAKSQEEAKKLLDLLLGTEDHTYKLTAAQG